MLRALRVNPAPASGWRRVVEKGDEEETRVLVYTPVRGDYKGRHFGLVNLSDYLYLLIALGGAMPIIDDAAPRGKRMYDQDSGAYRQDSTAGRPMTATLKAFGLPIPSDADRAWAGKYDELNRDTTRSVRPVSRPLFG